MESFVRYLGFLFAFVSLVMIGMIYREMGNIKKMVKEGAEKNPEGMKIKLVAIERLTLFAERSGLKNLILRTEIQGLDASSLHHILTETLKAEYEHNMSQQVYVSPEVWNAITRLKDQNIYIINHITSGLPPGATASDLARMIIEYSQTPNAEMNLIVLDALQYEAKKIMQ